jgi:hypothetical protein
MGITMHFPRTEVRHRESAVPKSGKDERGVVDRPGVIALVGDSVGCALKATFGFEKYGIAGSQQMLSTLSIRSCETDLHCR